jgi:O-acetyl-ADP-ribose deacetylase (regulator of RNase III)
MAAQLCIEDYWEFQADVRVNTVNCVGVMGAGIAKEFKARYPEMFHDYYRACRDNRLQPGGIHVWEDKIINVATKDHWRQPSKYEWIEQGVRAIGEYLEGLAREGKIVSVALPAMGCANGGLAFPKVSTIVFAGFANQPHDIRLFPPL